MLSQKLRRGLAGLGVFAIGGLGLLAPTTAMAGDDSDSVPPTHISNTGTPSITVNTHFVAGENTFIGLLYATGGFHPGVQYVIKAVECAEDGCVPRAQNPGNTIFAWNNQRVNFQPGEYTTEDTLVFPDPSTTFSAPGIYAWTVAQQDLDSSGHVVPIDTATGYPTGHKAYLVRAYVVQDGSSFKYSAVTVEGGAQKVSGDIWAGNGTKYDELDYDYMGWWTGAYVFGKKVVNNTGASEADSYTFKVTLKPSSDDTLNPLFSTMMSSGRPFDDFWGDTSAFCGYSDSEHVAADSEKIAGMPFVDFKALSVQQRSEAWESNSTVECVYTLEDGENAAFLWYSDGLFDIEEVVPSGARYDASYSTTTVNYEVDTSTGKYKYVTDDSGNIITSIDANAGNSNTVTNQVVGYSQQYIYDHFPDVTNATSAALHEQEGFYYLDGGVTGTIMFTNTYKDIPPTGVLLEYLPYVLMVIIPLAGIGAYVAMRRKLLS